jgi:hypothetical protein
MKPLEGEHGLRIHTNPTGWWNEFLHREFLREHFAERADADTPVLLLLDEFSGHWTEKTKEYAKSINVHLMPVPPGLTSVCQPADVAWMRPFKDYMRGEWVSFLREQVGRHVPDRPFKVKSPVYEDVCKWVSVAWDKVTPKIIQTGYSRTGISVAANDVIERLQELQHVEMAIGELSEESEFDN